MFNLICTREGGLGPYS